jgi:HAD superfamily hydrolase (TIGR01457 family)
VSRATHRYVLGTAKPLATRYDVALLDLDGVVYLGPEAIAGASAALAHARDVGMRLTFVTNNASREPAAVATHLNEIGVPATADDVVTSSQAAARVLVDRCGRRATVLVVGSPALRATVERAGLSIVASADDRPDAVVQGYSSDVRYADLAEAALAIRAGAFWVATNADSTLPTARGLLPGNGALVAAVATATGRQPIVAGKPQLPLHAEAVRRSAATNPLVVGDRLDTDIEGANAADTDSLLVLTGVTRAADLVNVAPQFRPTYIAFDLAGLVDLQPEVEQAAGRVRCAGWSAGVGDGDRITLDGDGPVLAGLRTMLVAGWSNHSDSGSTTNGHIDADAALQRLGLR